MFLYAGMLPMPCLIKPDAMSLGNIAANRDRSTGPEDGAVGGATGAGAGVGGGIDS
jgi:hypothetical protein